VLTGGPPSACQLSAIMGELNYEIREFPELTYSSTKPDQAQESGWSGFDVPLVTEDFPRSVPVAAVVQRETLRLLQDAFASNKTSGATHATRGRG
jgi:hypothetical protein